MKKRILVFLLVVAILLLAISAWKNYSYSSEKEHLKNNMLSTSLATLQSISIQLDALLTGLEDNSIPYEECEDMLILLSNKFLELHFALKTYATYFAPPGTTRNSYSGDISFELISYTLVGGWGELNDNRYNGIMFDNAISDKEEQYLTALKKSVDNMIVALTTDDTPYQLAEISPSYLDEVIFDFTEKYDIARGDSPLKLLFE